ncbi:hypothetical protein LCGC14_0616500 [marine sediment metagenome]|uniref:Uncharacterized protein n=1 Tax=marine sediment metagenome TaxID=412755 RepID=A0A0F9RQC2_9ZZZZ
MGDQTLDAKGRKFGRGGKHQMNATHYIELLAALSSLHFYNTEKGADRKRLFQYYSGREENYEKMSTVNWGDIPFLEFKNKRNELLFFASFAIAYISFYLPLIRSEQFEKSRELIPWDVDNFKRGELKLSKVQTELDELKNYLMSFLEWICEINFSTDRDLKLLNKAVLSKLFKLEKGHFLLNEVEVKDFDFKNMLSKEIGGYNPVKYGYDDLWKNMCEIYITESGSTSGRFVSLLYDAVKRFCQYNYALELEEE